MVKCEYQLSRKCEIHNYHFGNISKLDTDCDILQQYNRLEFTLVEFHSSKSTCMCKVNVKVSFITIVPLHPTELVPNFWSTIQGQTAVNTQIHNLPIGNPSSITLVLKSQSCKKITFLASKMVTLHEGRYTLCNMKSKVTLNLQSYSNFCKIRLHIRLCPCEQ